MRTLSIALIMVTLALAGCAENAPAEDQDDLETKFEDIDVDDDKGAIRGIVLDPAIVPIEGATVTIKSLGIEAKTNVDGAFIFADLDPGTYFLSAKKIGFSPAQTSVSVEAGVDTPPIVKIQLVPDLENLPFAEVSQYTGYLQCGFGVPGVGSVNPCFLSGSVNTFDVFVQRAVTASQSELFWEGTNILGDGLSFGHYDPNTSASNYVGTDGPSPRILRVNGTLIEQKNGEGYESFLLRVFPGTTAPSLVAEQEFEIINTNFYGFSPEEGWTFLVDGKHPTPS